MATYEMTGNNWGYYIKRDGKVIRGPYHNRAYVKSLMAQLEEAENNKSKKRMRPCITCGEQFESEGSHNRMCNKCRASANDIYQGAV